MLDDLGLVAALEWLADDFTHRYDVKTALQANVDDATLTESAATAIFRIVQEALTNAARHAPASEVRIAISASADTCTVRIEDDGCGAEIDGGRKPRSFGLLGMRERARQLGGFVLIDSAPGASFRIAVHIPLSAIRSDQTRTP